MGAAKNQEFNLESQITGKADSLRNTILSLVARDKFDLAVQELKFYANLKGEVAVFTERTNRLFEHCEELILAIKAKRSFPNFDALPMAKRQEIQERVRGHFEDLQSALKRIEGIENDIKVEDARSTLWVVQATIASIGMVIGLAVVLETFKHMGLSFEVVIDDIIDALFKLIGL